MVDPEEKLLRNTYLNGLKFELTDNMNSIIQTKDSRHIMWADNNLYQKPLNIIVNSGQYLFLLKNKDIKPVISHLNLRPKKGCIKGSNNSNYNNMEIIIQNNQNNAIRINYNNSNLIITDNINKIFNNNVNDFNNNNFEIKNNNKSYNPQQELNIKNNIIKDNIIKKVFKSNDSSKLKKSKIPNNLNCEEKKTKSNELNIENENISKLINELNIEIKKEYKINKSINYWKTKKCKANWRFKFIFKYYKRIKFKK